MEATRAWMGLPRMSTCTGVPTLAHSVRTYPSPTLLFKEGDTVPLVISPTTSPSARMCVRPSHPAIDHLEADEPAGNPLGSFFGQRLAADEVPLLSLTIQPSPACKGVVSAVMSLP